MFYFLYMLFGLYVFWTSFHFWRNKTIAVVALGFFNKVHFYAMFAIQLLSIATEQMFASYHFWQVLIFFFGRKCDQHIKMKLFLGFHYSGLFEILHSKFSKQFVNFWMKSGFMNDFCRMNNLLPRNSQKIRATVCREKNLVGLESL